MDYINIGIIISAAATIVLVLLQDRSSGTGGAFGGGDAGGFYQTRRGVERTLFTLTIIFGAIFVGLSILNLTGLGSKLIQESPKIEVNTAPDITSDAPNAENQTPQGGE